MSEDLDKRLDAALEKRTDLEAKKQRLEGKLDAARKNLTEVENECREKGVEPEDLDETIDKLTDRFRGLVEQLEAEVADADAALVPYLKE